jgi:hypothetical protein
LCGDCKKEGKARQTLIPFDKGMSFILVPWEGGTRNAQLPQISKAISWNPWGIPREFLENAQPKLSQSSSKKLAHIGANSGYLVMTMA